MKKTEDVITLKFQEKKQQVKSLEEQVNDLNK